MIRRFVDLLPDSSSTLELGKEHYHHLIRVLRLKVNDEFFLFDSKGYESSVRIDSIGKEKLTVLVHPPERVIREPACDVTLAVALPKGDKIELILQKGTELGVKRFLLFVSKRSVSRPSLEKVEKKLRRWQEIIESACSQSGRIVLPEPFYFPNFQEMLSHITSKVRLCFSPYATETLSNKINPLPESVALLIGPEGGFTEEEEEKAEKFSFQKVKFGRLIYRAETAALAAVVPFVLD